MDQPIGLQYSHQIKLFSFIWKQILFIEVIEWLGNPYTKKINNFMSYMHFEMIFFKVGK